VVRFGRIALLSLLAFGLTLGPLERGIGATPGAKVDYSLPGRLALPWACGEAYEVTWMPEDHWQNGKATGLAYDFGLDEGTPVFAPAEGVAYFLRDQRPLETNLGNYVEIVVEDQWLVRLAHLRDVRSGEREVSAGELIGHAGRSGVDQAHLHLELLVRSGSHWVRPDASRLGRLYGVDREAFRTGALIVNNRCSASLSLAREVMPVAEDEPTRLGESLDLAVTLQNDGLPPVGVDSLTLTMSGPDGGQQSVRQEGSWDLAGISRQEVTVTAYPREVGSWQVTGVSLTSGGRAYHLPADGWFEVTPSGLGLVGVSSSGPFTVGDRISLEVWLEVRPDEPISLDDVYLRGQTDDGEPWEARAGHSLEVPAGGLRRVMVDCLEAPRSVGAWRISEVGMVRGEHEFVLSRVDQAFSVNGPELVVERLVVRATEMILRVANVGNTLVAVDRIDLWADGSGGTDYLRSTGDSAADLAPGESRLIHFDLGDWGTDLDFLPVDAGAWSGTEYYPLDLPADSFVALN